MKIDDTEKCTVEMEQSDDIPEEISQPLKKIKYENITEDKISEPKRSKNVLNQQPTAEELNQLRETENLYNNNLFRLQIEELISSTQIKAKHKERLTTWMSSFQNFLNDLPQQEFNKTANITKKNENPFGANLDCDQDITLNFEKPQHIETFGLYKLNSFVGPNITSNINLVIPSSCFRIKDFLNNRYFVKRYYYLLCVAQHLKISKLCTQMYFEYYNENMLLPILKIVPRGCKNVILRIFATPQQNYFKSPRFLPDMNNVKTNVFEKFEITNDSLKNTSTPFYNSVLAFDTTLSENNSFFETTLSELKNVQEGIKLITVWLKQRGLSEGCGSFSEEIVLHIIIYLVIQRKINKHMSSYQVVRNFWNFMSTNSLNTTPISISENVNSDVLQKFTNSFDVVILDKSGCYNVAAFLNTDVYFKVKNECEISLKYLDNNSLDSFHYLFLTRLPFHLQYDAIIDLGNENNFDVLIGNVKTEERTKFLGNKTSLIIKSITDVLKRGLTDRVTNIVPYVRSNNVWEYGAENKKEDRRILLGINLNHDSAFKFMELGPALNDPAEKEFVAFWGKLSSSRRFRDGTAKAAVLFDTPTIKKKREIVKTIIDYVMNEKLNLNHKLFYDECEEMLLNANINTWYPMGTNEDTTLKITSFSDELGQKIRSLEMSLSITGVQGNSNIFCYSCVFPPIPSAYKCDKQLNVVDNNFVLDEEKMNKVPRYIEPIESVIYLESSSKWPKNLETLRYMKCAFYLEISKLLSEKYGIISSVKPGFIDVFYNGLVFRYTIYIPKEIALLKREISSNGMVAYKDSTESVEMEITLNVQPKVISAMKGIQTQHPSYGISTAIAKRWIRSHLIDDFHFPDIVIGLLNVLQYTSNNSLVIPVSPQVAFLRLLKLISEYQWHLQSIVVNFNDELSNERISEIDSRVQNNRHSYPPLYIITPYDNGESVFTKSSPTREMLNRLKGLATATLTTVEEIIMKEALYEFKDLFIANWDGFNAVINIKPLLNPRRHEFLNSSAKNKIVFNKFEDNKKTIMPITNFDPVQIYLKELRDNYNDLCLFFHDAYGGSTIGVLWKPKLLEEKEFKVAHVNGRKLKNNKLVLNVDGIIEDFRILGKGLVKSIEIK